MSDYVEIVTRSKIKGTNDYYVVKIDKEDHKWISQLVLYVYYKNVDKTNYVYYKDLDLDGAIVRRNIHLPRTILGVNISEYNDFAVQYKNGDFLDLRKDNLKLITRTELRLGRK